MNKQLAMVVAGSILGMACDGGWRGLTRSRKTWLSTAMPSYTIIGLNFKPIGAMVKGRKSVRRRRRGPPRPVYRNDSTAAPKVFRSTGPEW